MLGAEPVDAAFRKKVIAIKFGAAFGVDAVKIHAELSIGALGITEAFRTADAISTDFRSRAGGCVRAFWLWLRFWTLTVVVTG